VNQWLASKGLKLVDCTQLDTPGATEECSTPSGHTYQERCSTIWEPIFKTTAAVWGAECNTRRAEYWGLELRYQLIHDIGACSHSPLILDLDGDGVALGTPETGPRFDLLGGGSAVHVSWPSPRDGFLALDRNGNGMIDGAEELFGNATGGRDHADGFAALAELDANGDGVIDRHDPVFAELVVWLDSDGDGRSASNELKTLADLGIRRLSLDAERVTGDAAWDAHANSIPLVSRFDFGTGRSAALVDAYLRYRP
jgi:hypothetical protein